MNRRLAGFFCRLFAAELFVRRHWPDLLSIGLNLLAIGLALVEFFSAPAK